MTLITRNDSGSREPFERQRCRSVMRVELSLNCPLNGLPTPAGIALRLRRSIRIRHTPETVRASSFAAARAGAAAFCHERRGYM